MGIIPRVRERVADGKGRRMAYLREREGKNRRHTTMCLSLSYLPTLSSLSNLLLFFFSWLDRLMQTLRDHICREIESRREKRTGNGK